MLRFSRPHLQQGLAKDFTWEKSTDTDDIKGSVAGSLLSLWQPNKNWGLLLWLTGHPRHWELKHSTRKCLPAITPTALPALTAENADQDPRHSIHYLQAHSSWEGAASSASLAVLETWRETMSWWASNSTGQQFMLKPWNNSVISNSAQTNSSTHK